MMRSTLSVSLLLALLLAGCGGGEAPQSSGLAAPAEQDPTVAFNRWLDAEFAEYLDFNPMSKTRLGDKSDYDKLGDGTVEAMDRVLDWRRGSVAEMKEKFSRASLTDQGKISWDLWTFMLEREEAGVPFRYHRYIFGRRGPHTSLPNSLINYHKVETVADLDAYLARVKEVDRYLGELLVRAKASADKGIRASYFDYETARSHSERVINGAPFTDGEPTAWWQDITGKIDALVEAGELTAEQAGSYRARFEAAMIFEVKPFYESLIAWLSSDRANVSDEAQGASALPDGEAYYNYRLASMTTLPLTAEQIHQTGLDEVARIHAEMDSIRQTVEFDGTLQEFFVYMRESDEFYFPSTDEGREAYLEMARGFITDVEKVLPDYFGLLPKAGVEVRRVEAFREQAGGAAHYARGTPDGERPGVFYAHLIDMSAAPKFRLENLTYHEALPGHHMQISIQQELEGVPRFRSYHGYTAYSEGWGLYAEYLGKDMGFYRDPYSDFGRLSGELWRAIRLVVDTGIHAKGWTEAEAVEYATLNSPKANSAVKSEIRRYFNNPAQATAYKIGMNKILALREKAMMALGDRFDYRDFHDVILGGGPLPLPVLEARVDAWLAEVASG